jgi:2,3-bisphosphoglycerate-independent phosphoglycerate mutase
MVERDKQGRPKRDEHGEPRRRTSHSLHPVPFAIHRRRGPELVLREDLPDAGLANVAATVLELLGFAVPGEYEPSLLA